MKVMRMNRNSGFTLIEMAVVLGIIAILAAILTPMAVAYIDQARITRAEADVRNIAKAYRLYYRDASFWPVYNTRTLANAGTPSINCQITGPTLLNPTSNQANWSSSTGLNCTTATMQFMRALLNVNSLAFPTTNVQNGALAFHGPYVDGVDSVDPWGNPYVVNSKALDNTTQLKWAIAISAGPNGTLETDPWQNKSGSLTVSGDDIVEVVH
jgi:prepilin-type N-terminal cleavage/methylation domain-containing protein